MEVVVEDIAMSVTGGRCRWGSIRVGWISLNLVLSLVILLD